MTDDEFESYWESYSVKSDEDIESRVKSIMDNLAQNYDLRDMFVNDTLALQEWARMQILLDDLGMMERQAINDGEINKLSTLSKVRKEYIDNQSRIATDLNITRKSRQSEVEALESYLPSILKKAKHFYEKRLAYIYCPKCNMLVANTWLVDWNLENKFNLTCPRKDCNNKFEVTSEFLTRNKNKNVEGVLHV